MSHHTRCRAAALALAAVCTASHAQARPFRVNQVPNGPVAACFTCHVYPGGPRNAFGATVENYGGVGFLIGGDVQWGTLAVVDPAHPSDPPKTLAEIDSDGDGRTNGEELLDPNGAWRVGDAHPGASSLARLPGLIDQPIIIRQIYTRGGAAGAVYDRDFVELYNRSTAAVSIAGWSLQLASAFGGAFFGATPATLTPLPAISLAPGQSILIAGAGDGTAGSALPTADVVDPTPPALPVAGGKLVLATTSTPLACNGTFPDLCSSFESLIVDAVGYGSADYYEGIQPAPAPGATTSIARRNAGCTDINSNGSSLAAVTPDFGLVPAAPRNAASPPTSCTPPPPVAVAVPATSASHWPVLGALFVAAGLGAVLQRRRRSRWPE